MLGKFDRAWFDRPIFGKRRYMSRSSTGKKFLSALYIEQAKALPESIAARNSLIEKID
jgi:deoxyribodipyrimidine photo-lyase